MNYKYRKAYAEMIKKENQKSQISEDVPTGAMDSGSYMKTSLENPNDKNAIYVAFKDGKCKTFDCPVTRRNFMDKNKGWKVAETVKEDEELTFEENLFWEEMSAYYEDEDGNEISEKDLDLMLDNDDILVEDEEINERIIKTWVKSLGKKILRMVSNKKGYKVVKDKKTGIPHEVRLTMQEIQKRKKAAKRAKKYYSKNRKKKLSYMKKRK